MPRGGRRPGAGRPKGSPNRRSEAIRQRLEDEVDPIGRLIHLAETTDDPYLKAKVWLALLTYAYPKLKAVSAESVEAHPPVTLNVLLREDRE